MARHPAADERVVDRAETLLVQAIFGMGAAGFEPATSRV
jgi:hypothetical protein